MPECHIVNYSSLAGPSSLTTALEINKGDVESHLNQEGRLGVGLCHYAQLYHTRIWEMLSCKAAQRSRPRHQPRAPQGFSVVLIAPLNP